MQKKRSPQPQLARGTDRKKRDEAERLLRRFPPEGSRDVQVGVSTFRRTAGYPVFDAKGFVRWKSKRGKICARDFGATGKEPDGANMALASLLTKMANAHLVEALDKPTRTAAKRSTKKSATNKPAVEKESKSTTKNPPGEKIDRGMRDAAHRLLRYLTPEGAREVKTSVVTSRRVAGKPVFESVGSIRWISARGKNHERAFAALGREPSGANMALANLLAKLEKAPIVAGGVKKKSPTKKK